MKKGIILAGLLFLLQHACAQPFNIDSLKRKIDASLPDTNRVLMLGTLSNYYNHNHLDSGFYYVQKMIGLSRQLNYPYGEAWGLSILATSADRTADFAKSLEIALSCLHLAEKLSYGRDEMITRAYTQMGVVNFLTGHFKESISYLHRALDYAHKWRPDESNYYQIYTHLGNAFWRESLIDTSFTDKQILLDSAKYYAQKGYTLSFHSDDVFFFPYVRNVFGDVVNSLGNREEAKQFYRDGIRQGIKINHLFQLSYSYDRMSNLFNKADQPDSAIYFAKKSLDLAERFYYGTSITLSADQLYQAFEKLNRPDSALKYLKLTMQIKDKVMSETKQQQFQLLDFEEQQRQEKAKLAEQQYRVKIRTTFLVAGVIVLVVLISLLYRNNRIKQRSNRQLTDKTRELEKAMKDLKDTQSQLIQSEKMASLGELTAGIAHEIQNPLNFVNNFSEVNKELLAEMNEEIQNGNFDEVKSLAKDVIENQEKINHHGLRAAAIVKGMLQHSRISSGQKEPTDINALCDEYVRLSYHGFRAKDKNFNAETKTDFDPSIGKINIVPQDIGRVILNLINNAFYTVNEKKKLSANSYQPLVEVKTRSINDKIEIIVSDNGNGIPDSIRNKIFQPFFTTKPAGSGTGLGLSLSYDIIKAHGGEIKVETKENEGSEFVIQLPVV